MNRPVRARPMQRKKVNPYFMNQQPQKERRGWDLINYIVDVYYPLVIGGIWFGILIGVLAVIYFLFL
jgi:hypothetical protein